LPPSLSDTSENDDGHVHMTAIESLNALPNSSEVEEEGDSMIAVESKTSPSEDDEGHDVVAAESNELQLGSTPAKERVDETIVVASKNAKLDSLMEDKEDETIVVASNKPESDSLVEDEEDDPMNGLGSKRPDSDSLVNEKDDPMNAVESDDPSSDSLEEKGDLMIDVESKEPSDTVLDDEGLPLPVTGADSTNLSNSSEDKADSSIMVERIHPTIEVDLNKMSLDDLESSVQAEPQVEPRRSSRHADAKKKTYQKIVTPPKTSSGKSKQPLKKDVTFLQAGVWNNTNSR
jgi:hypothetical protein